MATKSGSIISYTIADPSSATNTYTLSYDSLDRLSTVAANNLGTFTNSYLSTTSLVSSVAFPSGSGESHCGEASIFVDAKGPAEMVKTSPAPQSPPYDFARTSALR